MVGGVNNKGPNVNVQAQQNVNQAQQNQGVKPADNAAKVDGVGIKPLSLDDIRKIGGGEPLQPKKVTVRFAPSPTGHLHIGGAWVALRNAMLAKKLGGDLVLRIEDTDQLRSKPEYTEAIMDGLSWLGVEWKGDPIFQSQRTELYKNKVQQLVDEGKAYKDASGAVFFKMPKEGTITVNDRVKGAVHVDCALDSMKDFPIQRSDGSPTFLLANVVDDGEQGVTHILRGDDHLGNAARQVPLFRAMGYDVPEFYHMPLIHGDDGQKLSKRHGATSVFQYKDLGYDSEVLMNHLARIGCSFDTEQTMSFDQLSERFDPMNISKGPGKLGLGLLDARMMHHIKKTPTGEIVKELKGRLANEATLTRHVEDKGTDTRPGFFERTGVTAEEAMKALTTLSDPQIHALADGAKARASTFAEMLDMAAFFRGPPAYAPAEAKTHATAEKKQLMAKLTEQLNQIGEGDWKAGSLDKALDKFNGDAKVAYAAYGQSLRWMLTGVSDGVPLHTTMAVIGREESLRRLQEMTAG